VRRNVIPSPLASGISRHRWPIGEMRETKLGEIDPRARKLFPFYFLLPYQDPGALLRWRLYVRKRCVADLEFRRHIWEMCRRDCAFFVVTFAVIFEPRPLPRWLPFNLWSDQVSLLAWLEEIFGVRHAALCKTRGIGATWLSCAFELHKWLFVPECKIGVVTKDKDLLVSKDSNSLLGKYEYLYERLPGWAKRTASGSPLLDRVMGENALINIGNASVIQGFVCTAEKMRSMRFTFVKADEVAFWKNVDQEEWLVSAGGTTDSILYISTWNDFSDSFHRLVYEEESSLLRMHAYWWNNYERWQGAYTINYGRVEFVDKEYRHPPDYQFGIPESLNEGMLRSPWVDSELSKPGTNRIKTLRDLYGMQVAAQTNGFFSQEMQAAIKESIRPPDVQGLLDVSGTNIRIIPTTRSNIRLWGGIPLKNRGPYYLSNDLSQGVGANNSVCQVIDAGGEQVLEYGTNETDITTYARNVVLIARWLAGEEGDGWVLIDFEANGQQARPFRTELLRLNYGNIQKSEYRTNVARRIDAEKDNYFGTTNKDCGFRNLREMERAVLAMETIIRSDRVLVELPIFGKDEDDGQPTFPKIHKLGHGDYTQSYGHAWWRAKDRASVEARARLEGELSDVPLGADPYETVGNSLWSDDWR